LDFILEATGQLTVPSNKNQNVTTSDAATYIIYPGSTGDKWWDMQQLCNQVTNKAIPIFNQTHPDCIAFFIFDFSSAHGAYAPTALRAQNMNLNFVGKQAWLRDLIIPTDDPCIPIHLCRKAQTFVFSQDHPDPNRAGKPKGVQAVLEEHGLWQYYSQQMRDPG
jgi:hypothetical protein